MKYRRGGFIPPLCYVIRRGDLSVALNSYLEGRTALLDAGWMYCCKLSFCLPYEGVPVGGGWIKVELENLSSIHLRHFVPPPPKEDNENIPRSRPAGTPQEVNLRQLKPRPYGKASTIKNIYPKIKTCYPPLI
jgi:hypothetical protein